MFKAPGNQGFVTIDGHGRTHWIASSAGVEKLSPTLWPQAMLASSNQCWQSGSSAKRTANMLSVRSCGIICLNQAQSSHPVPLLLGLKLVDKSCVAGRKNSDSNQNHLLFPQRYRWSYLNCEGFSAFKNKLKATNLLCIDVKLHIHVSLAWEIKLNQWNNLKHFVCLNY